MKKKLTSVIAAAALAVNMVPVVPFTQTTALAAANQRAMENISRGLTVIRNGSNMQLSWRLLGTESYDTSFNVYRDGYIIANVTDSTFYLDGRGDGESLYQVAPVTGGVEGEISPPAKQWNSDTNYLEYEIPVPSGGDNGTMLHDGSTYTYEINDMSTGDLDGDGEYELVVKFMPSNAGESGKGYTGNVMLGAYELDGTPMWKDNSGKTLYIDLGLNIRANPHGPQFLVYDFNSDGIAEIATKTAQGTMDTQGNVLVESSTAPDYYTVGKVSDYSTDTLYNKSASNSFSRVNTGGTVLHGREYYTMYNGYTGAFIDTVAYHTPRTFAQYTEHSTNNKNEIAYLWGDDWGNRVDRFSDTVAYLDGTTPYAVEWRGYYHGGEYSLGRTGVGAYKLVGNDLQCAYTFDTAGDVLAKYNSGALSWNDIFGSASNAAAQLKTNNPDWNYCGNGNHNMLAADFDEDGMDEVASGSLCLQLKDGEFGVKWNYNLGHGDAFSVGRYIKGGHMLYFIVHEDGDGGMTVIDPYYDGEYNGTYIGSPVVLFYEKSGGDTGRGIMIKGNEGFFQIDSSGNASRIVTYDASTPDDSDDSDGVVSKNGYTFTKSYDDAIGIHKNGGPSYNSRIYWDGDVYEEALDGFTSDSANPQHVIMGNHNGSSWDRITFDGTLTNNATKNNVCLSADLIGDWREEFICRTSDGKIRLYTSNYATDEKIYTLMHDSQYRSGVASEQAAYNQPPHVSWYMGEGMDIDNPDITTVTKTASTTPTATKEPSRTYEAGTAASLVWQNNELLSGAEYTGYVLDNAYSSGVYTFHVSVMSESNATFNLRDNSRSGLDGSAYSNMITVVDFINDGTIKFGNNNWSSGSYTAGKWYDIDVTVDITNRTQNITVKDAETGACVASATGMGFRQDAATNIKRISWVGKSVYIKNCAIYTGDAPTKGTVTARKTVKAGEAIAVSTSFKTIGGTQPTAWVSGENIVYTLYKNNVYTPAEGAEATATADGVLISRSTPVGEYILGVYDGVSCFAYTTLNVTNGEPIRVSDEDIVLEINGVSGRTIADTVYSDTDLTQSVSRESLGINRKSSVLSVLAKISGNTEAYPEFTVDSYKVTLSQNGADLAQVTPSTFTSNNGICMSQFVGGMIQPGEYSVTVEMTISQSDDTYTVSKTGTVTIKEAANVEEYFYTVNGINVTVFVK